MKLPQNPWLRGFLGFSVTALFAAGLFFGLAWGLTQRANYKPPIVPGSDGTLTLDATEATLHGPPQIKLESLAGEKDIGYWDYDTQWLSWEARTPPPGNYTVALRYARPGTSGVDIHLAVGGATLKASVPGTGSWKNWKTIPLGTIAIKKSGKQTITLKASNPPSEGIVNFVRLTLTPER